MIKRYLGALRGRLSGRKLPAPIQDIPICSDLAPLAREKGWTYEEIAPAALQRRLASKTIPECILELCYNAPRWIEDNESSRAHRDKQAAERYYSQLYGTSDYPVFASFTSVIPRALMHPNFGCIRADSGEMIHRSTNVAASQYLGEVATPGEPTRLPGRYFSLLLPWSINYAHWLMDCLPRLAAVDFQISPGMKLLVHERVSSAQIDSLKLLGFAEDQIVRAPARPFVSDEIQFVLASHHSGTPRLEFVQKLRERLIRGLAVPPSAPHRRLYIDRKLSSRDFVNAGEIGGILQRHGFESIHPETLPFAEQARLFSEAAIVLGAHGAGTLNILFCPPGAHIVEIYNPRVWDDACARVASLLGVNHWHLFGENRGENFETWLNPEYLTKLLDVLERTT